MVLCVALDQKGLGPRKESNSVAVVQAVRAATSREPPQDGLW